ncbi:hypothetical protein [Pseudoxanthomonas sp. 10H]|uniref:hypothetical protein n=1 Tax=Pseudoxanthomonas sp. 10H TaxID=3242729 RepID=UPI003555F4DF
MRGIGGGVARRCRADDATARWIAVVLVVGLHVALYGLLGVDTGPAAPARARSDPDARMRVVFSTPKVSRPTAAAAAASLPDASVRPAATSSPDQPASPSPPPTAVTHEDDAWTLPAGGAARVAADVSFERDVFARMDGDAFGRDSHLPGVQVQDRSVGGWLQAEARRRACGSLRAAMQRQPESTGAIAASMRRWKCGP